MKYNVIKTIDDNTQWHFSAWLLVCLFIFNILDFESTYLALSVGMVEANHFIAWLVNTSGTLWAILWIKLAVYAHIFTSYHFSEKYRISCRRLRMQWGLCIMLLIYIGVVISNFYKLMIFTT